MRMEERRFLSALLWNSMAVRLSRMAKTTQQIITKQGKTVIAPLGEKHIVVDGNKIEIDTASVIKWVYRKI